jgi:NAD(P)H-flavin reductase
LKPGWDFLVKVGINSVRPYTLASWEPEKGYFDLVASLDPLGLTSKYFKSHPTSIRILPTNSSFYVPIGRPVVMIANGSGIAPFRSLTQYLIKHEEAPKLYL